MSHAALREPCAPAPALLRHLLGALDKPMLVLGAGVISRFDRFRRGVETAVPIGEITDEEVVMAFPDPARISVAGPWPHPNVVFQITPVTEGAPRFIVRAALGGPEGTSALITPFVRRAGAAGWAAILPFAIEADGSVRLQVGMPVLRREEADETTSAWGLMAGGLSLLLRRHAR